MKFSKFIINNYKGIKQLEIDLEKLPQGNIFPLVGLNESGKTTILEAISLIQKYADINKDNAHTLIHKKKKGSFSGKISISACLKLDDEDKNFINRCVTKGNLKMGAYDFQIKINLNWEYMRSKFDNGFSFSIDGLPPVKPSQRRRKKLEPLEPIHLLSSNLLRMELNNTLKKNIPKVLYFPNFLFDFPEKIYLEDQSNAIETLSETQQEYRKVIQDILTIANKDYKITTHLLDRMKNNASEDVGALKQTINDMQRVIVDKILGHWNNVFTSNPNLDIDLAHGYDENGYFLTLDLKQDNTAFELKDRSLGFRWFFSFLLFTEFRKARQGEKGEYLFLFDEPASNLHPSHQQNLLKLLEEIGKGAKIIYSTHSHYLLNPKFLLNTFVVQDKGMLLTDKQSNYEQDIIAKPYRQFVSDSNTARSSDFQPILDVLEYVDNPFTLTGNIVFTEGKYDYYILKWLQENSNDFNFYPGGGVTSYENVFREYLAHNRKFIAIFDDDQEGRKAKENYIEKISQELRERVFTLKNVHADFDGYTTENLFTDDDQKKIIANYKNGGGEIGKKDINLAIQQLFIQGEKIELSEKTKENFKRVFEFIKSKFNDIEG